MHVMYNRLLLSLYETINVSVTVAFIILLLGFLRPLHFAEPSRNADFSDDALVGRT